MTRARLITGSWLLLWALACGGGEAGDRLPSPNERACFAWVDSHNALTCMDSAQLDVAAMCPATLESTSADLSGYYRCLQSNARCTDGSPDLGRQIDCQKPGS